MAWIDKGLIFRVDRLEPWAFSHAYVPTTLLLRDRIRVYVAFWDQGHRGRLGYVDVSLSDPSVVMGYGQKPLVEDSVGGFDCDGVTPLSIVKNNSEVWLYYAGWKRDANPEIRYRIFVGLLIGDADGSRFERFSDKPILGPRHDREYLRTGGFIMREHGKYRCWLATQKGIHHDHGKALPVYDLEYVASNDGIVWPEDQLAIFRHQPGKVLGYGRCAIWRTLKGGYEGLFPVRGWDGRYLNMLYSQSPDGTKWSELTSDGKAFDHMMTIDGQSSVSFPSVVHLGEEIAMFYNGDDFGREGLRLAIWSD
ncbi:hypothetical protein [Thalassospira alkalitolerans]|uniref:Glycosyl hydrolase family 32 N-terminal domain-containing protein n=1 Tax=Thalassospira alkalitolerans TaxID=1293890 RepID=A0A1Y2LD43_9PROT|nr:hypothetical protein [Thalassospira alkalitolerans]OSQ48365.1 hypothetical protein TALK_08830 [Thalassospira alkalitolerans]